VNLDEQPHPGAGMAAPPAVERAVADFQRGYDRERSFEVLFARYRPRIERFLAPRVFSPDERLDLTQALGAAGKDRPPAGLREPARVEALVEPPRRFPPAEPFRRTWVRSLQDR
jgi:hypothetical protein